MNYVYWALLLYYDTMVISVCILDLKLVGKKICYWIRRGKKILSIPSCDFYPQSSIKDNFSQVVSYLVFKNQHKKTMCNLKKIIFLGSEVCMFHIIKIFYSSVLTWLEKNRYSFFGAKNFLIWSISVGDLLVVFIINANFSLNLELLICPGGFNFLKR